MRILLVEDEPGLAKPLTKTLTRHGFAIDWEEDGKIGLERAIDEPYDCLLLDINLPSINGLEICQKLRKTDNHVPIIMLTARSGQLDKVTAFEYGVDDYVVKPFDLKELILRIRALVRRNSPNQQNIITVGSLKFNPNALLVEIKGKQCDLSAKESAVLEYLLRHQGSVVTAEELLEHVWDREVNLFTQTVKTHIKTLRQKIDPHKKIIQTVRGAGYLIKKEVSLVGKDNVDNLKKNK